MTPRSVLRLIALIATATTPACTPSPRERLSLVPTGRTDRRIQEACTVTVRTCSRCHDLGKVVVTHFDSPLGWRQLVARMRLMTGSGITQHEVTTAETCLVYHDLGERGLAELAALPGGPS